MHVAVYAYIFGLSNLRIICTRPLLASIGLLTWTHGQSSVSMLSTRVTGTRNHWSSQPYGWRRTIATLLPVRWATCSIAARSNIWFPTRRPSMYPKCPYTERSNTPFTRSSKHRASVEQISSWLVQLTYIASSLNQLCEPAWSCIRGITELQWTDTVEFSTNWQMGKKDEPTGHWLTRTRASSSRPPTPLHGAYLIH